jgi:hypothetical protein
MSSICCGSMAAISAGGLPLIERKRRLRRRGKKTSNALIIVIIALVLLALVWSRTARVSRVGFPQRIAAPR